MCPSYLESIRESPRCGSKPGSVAREAMKLSLDPYDVAPREVTVEYLALASWYDSQPAIRRLWCIREEERLRVVIAIEPTLDGDDVYPTWFANVEVWTSELRQAMRSLVQLELIEESRCAGIEIDDDGFVIADLFWRDATLNLPSEVL